jgi:hypothetical protein
LLTYPKTDSSTPIRGLPIFSIVPQKVLKRLSHIWMKHRLMGPSFKFLLCIQNRSIMHKTLISIVAIRKWTLKRSKRTTRAFSGLSHKLLDYSSLLCRGHSHSFRSISQLNSTCVYSTHYPCGVTSCESKGWYILVGLKRLSSYIMFTVLTIVTTLPAPTTAPCPIVTPPLVSTISIMCTFEPFMIELTGPLHCLVTNNPLL